MEDNHLEDEQLRAVREELTECLIRVKQETADWAESAVRLSILTKQMKAAKEEEYLAREKMEHTKRIIGALQFRLYQDMKEAGRKSSEA